MGSLLKDSSGFHKACTEVLTQLATHKKKYIHENNKLLMKKVSYKAIIVMTKLRYKFLKNPFEANRFFYTIQINWCVSLLGKEMKNNFVNLD